MQMYEEQTEYYTRHVGLAAFLRYGLGDAAHLATTKVGQLSTSFAFSDPERCRELEAAFFSAEGAAVANARELLDCAKAIKATVAKAQRNDGTWEAEDGLG